MEGQEGLLFVNKKKQKNFLNLYRAGGRGIGPGYQKFFGSVFQKRTTSFPTQQSVA
jgi:hypothetical protein